MNRLLRHFILLFSLICITSISVYAQDIGSKSSTPEFSRKHQAGVRIGAWVNVGDEPPTSYNDNGTIFTSDISSANIYGEVFAGWRVIPHIMLELSLGVVNRGTVTLDADSTDSGSDVGNLYINPFLVEAHIYPFASLNSKIQPWVGGGGGLYVGRRSVQFINLGQSYGRYYGDFTDASQTKLGYTVTGGFDWILGKSIALEASGRWMPISFSESLALVDSYDAVAITVGIKYLFETKKKE